MQDFKITLRMTEWGKFLFPGLGERHWHLKAGYHCHLIQLRTFFIILSSVSLYQRKDERTLRFLINSCHQQILNVMQLKGMKLVIKHLTICFTKELNMSQAQQNPRWVPVRAGLLISSISWAMCSTGKSHFQGRAVPAVPLAAPTAAAVQHSVCHWRISLLWAASGYLLDHPGDTESIGIKCF